MNSEVLSKEFIINAGIWGMTRANILVVEDDPDSLNILRRKLKKLGYNIIASAESGEEALEKASLYPIDLAIMDILIKGSMDGIAAAGNLHRKYRIPVIYLTSYVDDRVLERIKSSNPFGYLIKPVETEVLQINIEIALNKTRLDRQIQESEAKLHEIIVTTVTRELAQLQRKWGPEPHPRNAAGIIPICSSCKKIRDEQNLG